jgi:hypothetical protein
MSAKKRRPAPQDRQPTQDEFSGLKRKLERFAFDETEMAVASSGEVKMSKVLGDFVAPYAPSAHSEEAYRMLLTLAVLAWNASFVAGDEQEAMINEIVANGLTTFSYRDVAEIKLLIRRLIDRRQSVFAEHTRLIVSFDWSDTDHGYQLSVASTPG